MSKSLNHLKETIKHAHDPVICIEKVTGKTACNEPFLNTFLSGYGLDDFRLLMEKIVVDTEQRKDFQSEIEHLLKSTITHHQEIILKDILFENTDGELCNKNAKISSYMDGLLVFLEEVSFNQFTKEVFDTLPELIIFTNDRKEIIFSNNVAQNLLNIYPDKSSLRENLLARGITFFNANGEIIETDDFISKVQKRMRTLTVVHELAIHSEDLLSLDLANYLSSIIYNIHQSGNEEIRCEINLYSDSKVEVCFDKAIDCGLIINELIFNAIKYAFKGIHKGRIDVYLYVKFCFVKVKDNGIGLPDDFSTKQEENIGLQVMLAL